MEADNKTQAGFFDQIAFSVQPDKYKELSLLPKKKVVFYVLLMGICLTIMNYVIPMAGWLTSFGGLDHFLKEGLPKIEFSHGVLSVDDRIEMGKGTPQHLLVDTSKEKITPEEVDQENYMMEVLVSKTNMLMYADFAGTVSIDFSMYQNVVFTNDKLLEMKPAMYTAMVIQFFSQIIREIMQYLIAALPLAFGAWLIVSAEQKKRMQFSQAFVLTLYAKTAAALFLAFNASANLLKDQVLLIYGTMMLTVILLMTGIKKAEGITK